MQMPPGVVVGDGAVGKVRVPATVPRFSRLIDLSFRRVSSFHTQPMPSLCVLFPVSTPLLRLNTVIGRVYPNWYVIHDPDIH